MRAVLFLSCPLIFVSMGGCGSASEAEETPERHEDHTSGNEAPVRQSDDGVAVEGLMGTISSMAVQRGLEPKMGAFQNCFIRRYGEVEVLGGRIEMAFRIKTDGSVRWVYPRQSSLGDRDTERCILETAERTRFSRPQGGEAEFTYPLELDVAEDVRPPLNWDTEQIAEQIDAQRETVSCGRGPFEVTAYINRGGTVLAVGASAGDPETADNIDCVCNAVLEWEMPDPGSYPAKVSFAL